MWLFSRLGVPAVARAPQGLRFLDVCDCWWSSSWSSRLCASGLSVRLLREGRLGRILGGVIRGHRAGRWSRLPFHRRAPCTGSWHAIGRVAARFLLRGMRVHGCQCHFCCIASHGQHHLAYTSCTTGSTLLCRFALLLRHCLCWYTCRAGICLLTMCGMRFGHWRNAAQRHRPGTLAACVQEASWALLVYTMPYSNEVGLRCRIQRRVQHCPHLPSAEALKLALIAMPQRLTSLGSLAIRRAQVTPVSWQTAFASCPICPAISTQWSSL